MCRTHAPQTAAPSGSRHRNGAPRCGPVAAAVAVLILAALAAGWAHAAPHQNDRPPKVGDHYQPAPDDGSHKVERAPARKVCEHDAHGRVVRCRELQQ